MMLFRQTGRTENGILEFSVLVIFCIFFRLAATKGRKITRRDLLGVNVQRTCRDIVDYVLVRVAPLSSGLPRPRFSLYLSSQLQYGVVLIFHRQCQLLLEEIQGAIDKMHRYRKQVQIDMPTDESRQYYLLPDALDLLNELEGVSDPFFGTMEFGLPSPSDLIQPAQQMEAVPPESPPSVKGVSLPLDGLTASQESITLTEREPIVMPEPEFEGEELQEGDMIDMLQEQPDHFPEGDEEREREAEEEWQPTTEREREREMERERKKEREREREREREEAIERERERAVAEIEQMREMTGSTISMEPAQVTEGSGRDVLLEPEEDLGLPAEMPELVERERTPVSEPLPIPPSPPSPEEERQKRQRESPVLELVPSSPEAPLEHERKKRRQLIFIDKDTQISQEALQAQINNTRIETKPLRDILIKAPSQERSASVLLSTPCMRLPPDILELWRRNAVIHPLRHPQEAIPEMERAREELDQGEPQEEVIPEIERAREELDQGEPEEEVISKETPREMVESGISQYDTPVSSLGMLEITERETLPLETPETQRSPVPIPTGLEDIPEERVPELEAVTMDIDDVLRRQLVMDEQEVTFHSLLPPVVNRRTVAHAFLSLLEQIDKKQVIVRQDKPFGDIFISQIQDRPPAEGHMD